MKTLQTLQFISKAGKILSKIVFICCIVGFCGCILGIIGFSAGETILEINGLSLKNIIEVEADMTIETFYTTMAVCMLLCASEAVLAKFAEHYFKGELADGTPFNTERARELLRLGILTICIPIGTNIIAAIFQEIMAAVLTDITVSIELDTSESVGLGVMFIIISLICRCGAELCDVNNNSKLTQDSTENQEN